MEVENIRTKTIKILPQKVKIRNEELDQNVILYRWFGISRLCYNYTIRYLENNDITSFYTLRRTIINMLKNEFPYTENTPFDIRANAIKDAHIAMSNAIKLAKKDKKWINLSYRTKKDLTQSIFLPKATVKSNGFFTRLLKNMKYSEILKDKEINGDCRLCYKRHDGFYLLVPQKLKLKTKKTNKKISKYCAIDPGVRTFATCYSPTSIMEFGNNDIKRIERLHGHIDEMISDSKNVNCKKRQKILKNAHKLRLKIRNLVKDLHWKVGKILCKNFKGIFLPVFKTQQMVNKNNGLRKINKKISRNMLTMSHYLFRIRLINQAKKYGADIYIVNESYTSKTCSNCGWINDKLGSSKVFECLKCGIKMDRDINGARGIYIRQLSLGH